MAEQAMNVIFRGDIVLGHNLAEVKARFAQLFKLPPEKLDTYFSGRPVALKKSCDLVTAEKFKQALTQIGCIVQIKPADEAQAQQPVAKPTAAGPNAAKQAAAPAKTDTNTSAAAPFLPNADAQQPVERAIDISHLSLVKRNPFSDEAEEPLEPPRTVVPPVLDLSKYALEPASDEWLEAARDVPELELDLSGFNIEEVGADLLKPDEIPLVEPVVVDVSAISVAEPGADLGELDKPAPPPAPDTSHLSLN